MAKLDKLLRQMRDAPASVAFTDLRRVCDHYFGDPRIASGSHRIYATPWKGDPRVNIQNAHGKAKRYQVCQVLAAIDRLEQEES